ncbi:4'-phosphopantetheinyl transferase superfamily protein [bacterium]|nr:4'-phosphopantetheinyl transferase superfamily protein [bacterium]
MANIIAIKTDTVRYSEIDAMDLRAAVEPWCPMPEDIEKAVLTRRAEWLAGRLAAKRLLEPVLPDAVVQMHSIDGYPMVIVDKKPKEGFFLSWAHASGWAIAALGPQTLGIDLEPENRPVKSVLERISDDQERAAFSSGEISVDGKPAPLPLAFWVAKEAAAKATGQGMRHGLKGYRLGSAPTSGGVWPLQITTPGPRPLRDPAIRFFRIGPCLGALCSERPLLLESPHFGNGR